MILPIRRMLRARAMNLPEFAMETRSWLTGMANGNPWFSETRPETTEAIKISFRSCGNELPGKKHVHCVVVCTYLNINIPDSPTYPPASKNRHCWRCFIVFVKQRFNPLAASWSLGGGGATRTMSVVYLCLLCMWGPQSMRQNYERLSNLLSNGSTIRDSV